MIYYRVAIQLNASPGWQWKSTALSSLDALFRVLRLYSPLPQDRLRVFSASSCEGLGEQLVQENHGWGSNSVTAAQFLQKRLLRSPGVTSERREQGARENQGTVSIAGTTSARLNESSMAAWVLCERNMSSLDMRRLEVELGVGGDHDIPYTFALPPSISQILAWMRLLAWVHRGELQP